MINLKKSFFFLIVTGALLLSQCPMATAKPLKIGVTAGPHAIIMEKVREEAQKKGLSIDIVEFNDFILPNVALQEGDLDANSMQHLPYLNDQNQSKGYTLKSIGSTVLMPMGGYSNTLKKIEDLKEGAKVGIPNDPSNGARALLLLQKAGLLKLKEGVNMPSILDITENPKKIEIIELEAPQIFRSLDDLDCAITNTDWVVLAKRDPASALFQEGKDSPYVNIIAVRDACGEENSEDLKKFVEIYHSQPIKNYIVTEFKGAVIPAF